MKVFAFIAVVIAVGVAFPSVESEDDPLPEMLPELKRNEPNDFLAVEGNPKGDNSEIATERAKRWLFYSAWPYVYSHPVADSYPIAYSYPVVRQRVLVA